MNVSTSYPPAPWHLAGQSVQVLRRVPVPIARAWVPPQLKIVPVAPGMTLGVLYCARYDGASTLCYNELAVAPALSRIGVHVGFWISHIYVDSLASVAGGRDIWGLQKQLAQFRWTGSGHVEVLEEGRRLCAIGWDQPGPRAPMPLLLPVLTRRAPGFARFQGRGLGRVALCRGSVEIDRQAPFAAAQFERAHRVADARIRLRVGAPSPGAVARERGPR